MKYNIGIISALSLTLISCTSDKQIEEWVQKNPEKIMKALMDHQRAQQEANQPKPEDVKQNAAALFEHEGSPRSGSGNIKIAYFFDFNCGHCARQKETIKEVLKKHSDDVQVVYKNLPVLGPASEMTARGALAAHQQNKFVEFYEEAYKNRPRSPEALEKVAKKIGLDMKRWKADMESEVVTQELSHVQELAGKLKIRGTPFLAIAPDKVFPGRVDQLMEIVESIKQ